MGSFDGKIVVITGAAGAIGASCARRFFDEGAVVVGVDIGSKDIFGVNWLAADLGSESSIVDTFAAIVEQFGTPDVLVQSAAVLRRASFLELSAEDIDFTHAINVRAVLLCAREAARAMAKRGAGGVIINLGSVAAHASDAVSIAYDASKGALRSASRGMAIALAPHGVRVIEVAPGPMSAPQGMVERSAFDLDAYSKRRIPLARWGVPDDVAGVVLFAASDAAAYVTGSTLHVDGGLAAAY